MHKNVALPILLILLASCGRIHRSRGFLDFLVLFFFDGSQHIGQVNTGLFGQFVNLRQGSDETRKKITGCIATVVLVTTFPYGNFVDFQITDGTNLFLDEVGKLFDQ